MGGGISSWLATTDKEWQVGAIIKGEDKDFEILHIMYVVLDNPTNILAEVFHLKQCNHVNIPKYNVDTLRVQPHKLEKEFQLLTEYIIYNGINVHDFAHYIKLNPADIATICLSLGINSWDAYPWGIQFLLELQHYENAMDQFLVYKGFQANTWCRLRILH